MAKSPEAEAAPAAPEGVAAGWEPLVATRLFDNPSLGRALRYTFAEKRLARAVFVNALLLVVVLAVVQEAFGRGQLGLYSDQISYGRVAFLGLVAIEAVVLSILAPLGSMFLFEAERREECFDQVVASGASPHRVVFGRLLATLAFLGVVLLSSLPFLATTVVLDGATIPQLLVAYGVLAAWATMLATLSLACAVALDDTALPGLIAVLAVILVGVLGFSRRAFPPVFAAFSPVRHAALEQADMVRDLRLGTLAAPEPFGAPVDCALLSLSIYGALTLLGLAYAWVGPDLELAGGLDAFDSVSTSPKAEATRARRGAARSLLRAVQVRFFYENVGPWARALSPLVRALATLLIFAGAHALFLGALWPGRAPAAWQDVARGTGWPYLGFTLVTLWLLALAGAASRAALLSRVPVLRLGPLRLGRFTTLFFLMGAALALPPGLWVAAGQWASWPADVIHAGEARQMFALVAGYAGFVFALALLLAMLTTNPYSATGWTLILLFASNVVPLVWIPLFTGNLAGERSAVLLDLSPLAAAASIARPGEGYTFTTILENELVRYEHFPRWQPFAWFHGVVGGGCLVAGLVGAWRERRRHLEAVSSAREAA